jgi:PEP-CTERM motif
MAAMADASPVSVFGGFTSFTGEVGGGQFVTTINGAVICPTAGCSTTTGPAFVDFGVSTPQSSVDFSATQFGTPLTPNALSFTPAAAQDATPGEEFLLGTMSYTNGVWFSDPSFNFRLQSVSSDPNLNGFVFGDTLKVFITPNSPTHTAEQNADFVWFGGHSYLGSGRAFEFGDDPSGNTLTFDVYGKIGSLDVTRFANPSGGGFLDPSVSLEPSVGVSEPATLTLLSLALAGLGLRRRLSRTIYAPGRRDHDRQDYSIERRSPD